MANFLLDSDYQFEVVSGLKINFAKSSCGAFGVSDRWTHDASNYLKCSLMSFPFSYLGIPIGANPRRCQTWEPIITKCERTLARWKQRHLSFGGRVTLINSVLTSIPIYFFSFSGFPDRWLTSSLNYRGISYGEVWLIKKRLLGSDGIRFAGQRKKVDWE